MKMILTVIGVICFLSSSAFACPGAQVEINDSSWLSAEGIYGSKGLEVPTEELDANIKKGSRTVYDLSDRGGIKTHIVEFLGSVGDAGGFIQAVFAIKDLKSNEEKTLILKSNYVGNGIRAKGLDSPDNRLTPTEGFTSVLEAGCH